MSTLKIENNTCIVSSCLLDELDYIVGGYGQPTVESIFNLNVFIEAYVLSTHFIFTKQELDHLNITSKVLFPNGRPILDLIKKSENLFAINGIGNQVMRCVYVDNVSEKTDEVARRAIMAFTERDADKIKKNLVLSDLAKPVESINTFTLGFGDTQIVIGETRNKPFEIVKSFYDTITNYNVQSALPIFGNDIFGCTKN